MDTQEAQKQLDLIERTIAQAKRSFYKGSGHYLIWGWGLFVAAISQYVLMETGSAPELNWLPWPIVAILGGIAAGIYERSRDQRKKEATDRIFAFLWGGFGISLFLLILGNVANGNDPNPYVIILMGLPTFTSGGILRSAPLLVGAVLIWGFGILACFLPQPLSPLAFAAALLSGYIVPGHILRSQEKSENKEANG